MLKFINQLKSNLKVPDLTIDLTGGNTVIYQQGRADNPIRVNEPAILVVDGDSCLAFGKEAEDIRGKCPEGVNVIYPVQKGVIADPDKCEQLLKHYLDKLNKEKKSYCFYPNVVAVIPESATASTQKIMTETIDSAGVKGIDLIPSLQAAATGIGFDKETSGASIILNIAKDYTEIGIISLNKIHFSTTLQVGYDDFQRSIIDYIRDNSDYSIGVNNAKKALDALGAATYIPEMDDDKEVRISGLLKRTSVPEELRLLKSQVHTAIEPLVERIVSGLLEVLEKAREDMAADLMENGVHIMGAGGRIARMDSAISQALNLKAKTVKNYETCVVEGAAKIQRASGKA